MDLMNTHLLSSTSHYILIVHRLPFISLIIVESHLTHHYLFVHRLDSCRSCFHTSHPQGLVMTIGSTIQFCASVNWLSFLIELANLDLVHFGWRLNCLIDIITSTSR